MPKNSIADWSQTAVSNSDVGGINIAEGCPPGNMNDMGREIMKQMADYYQNSGQKFAGSASVGVALSGWSATYKAIELPTGALWSVGPTSLYLTSNAYNNGTNYIYDSTNAASQYFQAAGVHYWQTAASGTAGNTFTFTTRMTLDNGGNLGIGVTPSAWASTWKVLETAKVGSAFAVNSSNGNTGITANAYNNGAWTYAGTGNATLYQQATGQHVWYYAASGTAGNAITFTQAMTLDASGNLGIGVTPSAWQTYKVLQLGRQAAIFGDPGGTSVMFTSNCYWNGSNWLRIAADYSTQYRQEAGVHKWFTADTSTVGSTISFSQSMTLDTSGNLQLGGASATAPLKYTIRTSSADVYMQATSTGAEFGTPNNVPMLFKTNDAERVRIDGAGVTQFVANHILQYQPAPTSKSAAATLTNTELAAGIIQYTGSNATLTLPTAANIEAMLTWSANNIGFDFFVIATGGGNATLGANGNTTVGNMQVSSGTSGHFRIRRTASTPAFTIYRLS